MILNDDMPMAALTIGQLCELIRVEAAAACLESSRRAAGSLERVSAGRAAVIAKKGRARVLAACASGSLPAQRDGQRWSIRVIDLDSWCTAGFPEAKR